MRRWFIGTNDYWFNGYISLEETPWYLIVLNDLVMHTCDLISRLGIPIPKKWREDYGNLGDVFHLFVCDPVTQFVWKRTEVKNISLPYFFLKKEFPDDMGEDIWEGEYDKQRKKNKKLAEKLDKRFNRAYNKVLEHEKLIYKERRRS
jgi:hypothetical protein